MVQEKITGGFRSLPHCGEGDELSSPDFLHHQEDIRCTRRSRGFLSIKMFSPRNRVVGCRAVQFMGGYTLVGWCNVQLGGVLFCVCSGRVDLALWRSLVC